MDDWKSIEDKTGWQIPSWVREGCVAPKLVEIPEGLELFVAGPYCKARNARIGRLRGK